MDEKLIVVVGSNRLDKHIADHCRHHTRAIFFEPLPEICTWLRETYIDQNVQVVQAACGLSSYRAPFRVYNHDGLSSSLGVVSAQSLEAYHSFDMTLKDEIEVQVVNLFEWFQSHHVTQVETLITDAQGMDLTILKTLEPMLEAKSIGHIECEADGEGFTAYYGLPSNSEYDFHRFMKRFPWYFASRLPDRRNENPDLTWTLIN